MADLHHLAPSQTAPVCSGMCLFCETIQVFSVIVIRLRFKIYLRMQVSVLYCLHQQENLRLGHRWLCEGGRNRVIGGALDNQNVFSVLSTEKQQHHKPAHILHGPRVDLEKKPGRCSTNVLLAFAVFTLSYKTIYNRILLNRTNYSVAKKLQEKHFPGENACDCTFFAMLEKK